VQRSRTCVEAEGHAGPEKRKAKQRRKGLAVGESVISVNTHLNVLNNSYDRMCL
jgi:hypothetical protein